MSHIITAGPAERNGRLPAGLVINITHELTAHRPESPTAIRSTTSMEHLYPYLNAVASSIGKIYTQNSYTDILSV